MDDLIDQLLRDNGGACARETLLQALRRNQFDNQVRQRRLIAVFPRAYIRPWDVDDVAVREAAAVASVGAGSALSHLSALRRWGAYPQAVGEAAAREVSSRAAVGEASSRATVGEASSRAAVGGASSRAAVGEASSRAAAGDASSRAAVGEAGTVVHVLTSIRRHPRSSPGLVVHRSRREVEWRLRDGVPTTLLDDSLVASWALLPEQSRRAPAILAVQRRLTTAGRLVAAANSARAPAQLRGLIELLRTGCRSELELWGHLAVFDAPGLRDAVRQRPVRIGGRTFYLDMAYEQERVAVELDGRAYHAGNDQWESDISRDLTLATIGWQTIRLSHRRLTKDIVGCRRDVLAVRAARRRQAS